MRKGGDLPIARQIWSRNDDVLASQKKLRPGTFFACVAHTSHTHVAHTHRHRGLLSSRSLLVWSQEISVATGAARRAEFKVKRSVRNGTNKNNSSRKSPESCRNFWREGLPSFYFHLTILFSFRHILLLFYFVLCVFVFVFVFIYAFHV
jgi:hypothetical protein